MVRLQEMIAREASRKVVLGGRLRAYWGPSGIGHLVRVTFSVAAREGPRGVWRKAIGLGRRALDRTDYAAWVKEQRTQEELRRSELLREAAALEWKPTVSVLLATRGSPIPLLRQAVDSVMAQTYPNWELLAVAASTEVEFLSVLREYASRDPRVRPVFRDNGGYFGAAMNAVLKCAKGDFICLMDPDDLIASTALFELVRALNRDPSLDMVYSDEDKVDAEGVRSEPSFKPDWSPEYLESCMYTARLAMYRKALVDQVGGFRAGMDAAPDYDLALRFTEQSNRVGHVATILYHRRVMTASRATHGHGNRDVVAAEEQALSERLARTCRTGRVQSSDCAGCFKVRWALPRAPLVSIIVPTAGGDRMVRGRRINLVTRCVGQIRANSTYGNYEIVIVDNGDLRSGVKEELLRSGCRFTTFAEPEFNISKKLNLGAKEAKGEFLLLLNDDTEIITPDWMEAMLEQALKSGVGVVGAKLLYENGTIQHAGVAYHEGLPDHVRKFFPANDPGYNFSTIAVRNYLAVTGACMLTRARDYHAVGGYDESFKINYSDIDYCLKLRERGLRTVYTPHAELYHYESASREFVASQEEIDRFLVRWKALTVSDPYYNGKYLQTKPPDFSLRLPAHEEVPRENS